MNSNIMRTPKLVRVVLSAGAVDKELEKAKKLLEMISERKAQITKAGSRTRIPAFGVRPKMELGTCVTLRGKAAIEILRKLLGAIDNQLKESQIDKNNFSFGINEYINIPGMKYIREIGIRGFNVTVVFERAGVRVKRRKIKTGRVPAKQHVTREEIMEFMKSNFKTGVRA
ncbi:50S ribosomal protein L5 [Candidatus Pacearchaeota archaeon]|nr:50S ribosomal protein L5 [Candidatus Pacearchaeota archaeon]